MPNANPFISLNDVAIRLQDNVLFENVSWEILDNQNWAVIGPNGSGKSTLMKALSGALPVASGKIIYHFSRDHGAQDHIAHVTFESQRAVLGDQAFYQERWNSGVDKDAVSVSDYLSERSINRNNPFHVIERPPDPNFEMHRQAVIEQLELHKLLGKSVVELSNGERRKVTIGRALLKNPRLLILDNPFAGLDEHSRPKLSKNLDALMQSDVHVIIVGTSRDEIPSGITHILSVNDKRVSAQEHRSRLWTSERSGKYETAKSRTIPTDPERSGQFKVLVNMKNVTVSYNGTPVLRQINWTVREQDKWALLGPNGAGKTTLLSLILADNPQAYSNDITLFGKRRGSGESIWEIKQNIGWVAPELQLYYPREATCLDVVCSGWFDSVGLFRECSLQQRAAALTMLQRVGLAEQAGTQFQEVSEGEQRLALLGRALVKNPTLIVLDEPCQGLDTGNRDRVLQAIDSVCLRSNTSMIYVTHRADELPRGITHVLRLNEGQVVSETRERT